MRIGRLVVRVACFALMTAGASVWALEPPTKEQVERYRLDGSLGARIEAARDIGNHLMAPHLAAATDPRSGGVKAAAPGGLPAVGNQRVLTLLIDFSDLAGFSDPAEVHDQLFGDGVNGFFPKESLRNFYRRSSYGLLDIDGSTLGWYTTPYPRSDVEQTTAGREALIQEVIEHFDAEGHDFTQYDNDGDGYLDYVIIIWAGPHQDWAEFWWGYKTNYRNSSFIVDGMRLGTYSWQWENYSYPGPFNPEVVIHETGHALGLPDYYDYDDSIGPDGGVGGLDQMDANWGDHNCFSKYVLGWLEPQSFNESNHQLLLAPNDDQPQAALLMHGDPTTDPYAEYFMVQYRRRQGNDLRYPTDGLLIWHVDARTDSNGRFLYDNSYTEHKLLRLMEADGLEEIESNSSADAGDFYRTGDVFAGFTIPNSNRYDGAPTNLVVDEITVGTEESSLQTDLGSGCALFCDASGGRSAWPRTPIGFEGSVSGENCDGEAAISWYLDDQVMSDSETFERSFPAGDFQWSFRAELGDASCSEGGPLLVCADERCWQWTAAEPMDTARALHAAVNLRDGRVLLAGGGAPETYDPGSCSCGLTSPASGAFEAARGVLLPDGRALVCGGSRSDDVTAEIYDPVNDRWQLTGQMSQPRFDFSAVGLSDGRVLVAGGLTPDGGGGWGFVHSTEIFDPQTETWSEVGSLDLDMSLPGLTLLRDGRVLLTSGRTGVLFDPATDSWGDPWVLAYERIYHSAVLLPDGRVLLTGGEATRYATAWDPETGREQFAGAMSEHRLVPSAVVLPSGNVLVTGGFSGFYDALASAEVFDPVSNSWTAAAAMAEPKFGHQTNLLSNGNVLITGGLESPSQDDLRDTVELFERPTAAPMSPGGRRQP